MVKQAEVKKFSWKQPFYVAAGILIVLLFTFIPTGTFQAGSDNGIVNFLLLMLAGFIAAVARPSLVAGIPTWPELLLCLVTLAAGFLAIYFLSRQELKYEEA